MRRLLMVEDDVLLTRSMVPVLEGTGYEVLVASDAATGLATLRSKLPVDLLILDVMLPLSPPPESEPTPSAVGLPRPGSQDVLDDETGGLEAGVLVLRRLRKDPDFQHRAGLPVLAYTLRGVTEGIRDDLESMGANVITKGGDPQIVLQQIEVLLRERGG